MKPKNRSNLRIALGKRYYMSKRYFEWCFGGTELALSIDSKLKPYTVFEHRTPLLRKLKDVDMWLQYNKILN